MARNVSFDKEYFMCNPPKFGGYCVRVDGKFIGVITDRFSENGKWVIDQQCFDPEYVTPEVQRKVASFLSGLNYPQSQDGQ